MRCTHSFGVHQTMAASTYLRCMLLVLAATLLAACGALTMPVPDAASIAAIQLSTNAAGNRSPNVNVLTDPALITKVLQIVKDNNTGWSKPLDTFPTPTASASFHDRSGNTVFILWFGSNNSWVGARSFAPMTDNLIWDIRPELKTQLRQLLGVNTATASPQP